MTNEQSTATAEQPVASVENVTGKRIIAAIIDIILLGVVFVLFAMAFGESDSTAGEEGASFNLNLEGLPGLIYFVAVLGYYIVLEAMTGKTIGKMLMGIRVVAIAGAYTPGKSVVRNLLRIIDGLPFLYLLGFLLVAVSKRNQRLGDMVAGTLVVRG